jgi:PAS domain S-box-containing protein
MLKPMDQLTFKALFEHSSLGIIISNQEGVIEKANPHAAKMFGYGLNELIGQKVEVLVPFKIREKHITYRHQYNKNPQPRGMGSNLNLMAVKRTGEEFPVEISLTHYEDKGLRQIVSFVNDITERKQAEAGLIRLAEELESKVNERTKELSDALLELSHTNKGLHQEMEQRKKVEAQIREMLLKEQELNELKSRFVSMASHEFRTPLGGILTSAALIAKYPKTEDEPKREKHIQTIKKSVKNLTNILNDFLSLDKLDQGKIASTPASFDFMLLIQDMVEEFRDTTKHNIILKSQEAEILLFQDKEMFRNVLINLIFNAIKYSPETSPVEIKIHKNTLNLTVEIKDHGIGIPLGDQKHLFERFFRAGNVTNVQGTGLGLNIVKRYLDLLNGSIEFESVENQGTTFVVTLPLEKV